MRAALFLLGCLLFGAAIAHLEAQAQKPAAEAPDTIVTADNIRVEATGVRVDVVEEGAVWVIRVRPK